MCGIVGVIGDIYKKQKDIFTDMLKMDVVRGEDSTGILSVQDTTKQVKVSKEAWLPSDLLQRKDADKVMDGFNIGLLIGHNRKASQGSICKANSHPFEFNNVIGVHNGGVIKSKFDNHASFGTDSEALYSHLNTHGIDETWASVDGAASLVYYDKVNNTVNFIRNEKRPMFIAISKSAKQIYFASEPWMIQGACWRNDEDLMDDSLIPTKLNRLYQINLDTLQCEERDVTPCPKPKVTYNNNWSSASYKTFTVQSKTKVKTNHSKYDKFCVLFDDNTNGVINVFSGDQCTKMVVGGRYRGTSYTSGYVIPSTIKEVKGVAEGVKKSGTKSQQMLLTDISGLTEVVSEEDFDKAVSTTSICPCCGKVHKFGDDMWYDPSVIDKDGRFVLICNDCAGDLGLLQDNNISSVMLEVVDYIEDL